MGQRGHGVTSDIATLNPTSPMCGRGQRTQPALSTMAPGKIRKRGSWCWGQGVLALGIEVSAAALLCATAEGSQVCRNLSQPVGKGSGMGSPYLLQQQSVLVALGQVVGSERALDAGPNDNDIVGGFLGLAWGSHGCPVPAPVSVAAGR